MTSTQPMYNSAKVKPQANPNLAVSMFVIVGLLASAAMVVVSAVDGHHQHMQSKAEYEKNQQITPTSHSKRRQEKYQKQWQGTGYNHPNAVLSHRLPLDFRD